MCTILETWIIREGTYEDSLKMRQIQNGENLESLLTDKKLDNSCPFGREWVFFRCTYQ